MSTKVFLDIDINHSREAYARAASFVEATDLRYNFSSKNITELGGRELQSVIDMYALDFDWGSQGDILIHPQPACRIVIELFPDIAPLACENFEALCTGSRGKSKVSGVPLHYKDVKFHRFVPNFIAQGGDFIMQNGSGGESIWGKKFKDDKGGLAKKHDKIGVVSMCNSGKNSNTCQFFFTLAPCPQLDGKHVIFGQVVSGFEVLDAMCGAAGHSPDNIPEQDLVITECGVWTPDMLSQGYWAPDGTFSALSEQSSRAIADAAVFDIVVYANKQSALEKFQIEISADLMLGPSCLYTQDKLDALNAIREAALTGRAVGEQDSSATEEGERTPLRQKQLVVVMAPGVDAVEKTSVRDVASELGNPNVHVVCVKIADITRVLRELLKL